MKKLRIILLWALVLICSSQQISVIASASSLNPSSLPLRIVVDGNKINFPNAQAFKDESQQVYLPLSFFTDELKATVQLDESTNKLILTLNNKTLVAIIGNNGYTANGVAKSSSAAPLLKDSTTFIPVEYVSALGFTVTWDDPVQTLYIISLPKGEADQSLRIEVNGYKSEFPVDKPFVSNQNEVYLPISSLMDVGAVHAKWDKTTQKITLSLRERMLIAYIGSTKFSVNGVAMQSTAVPVYKDSKVYVPVQFLSKLGYSVTWYDTEQVVHINSLFEKRPDPKTLPVKKALVHGFVVPYVEMGPNRDPHYVSASQFWVYENDDHKGTDLLMQLTISFNQIGADPVKGFKEAEAILRQKINAKVVDSVMQYARKKTKRFYKLPDKSFTASNYTISVGADYDGDVAIGIWPKGVKFPF